MYYYGNNGYYGGYNQAPCANNGFVGYTQGGFSTGGAIWIVLFILLVIIIGSGWSFNNNCNN